MDKGQAKTVAMAKVDIKTCLEALLFDADEVATMGAYERRFYMKKLAAAQELVDRVMRVVAGDE